MIDEKLLKIAAERALMYSPEQIEAAREAAPTTMALTGGTLGGLSGAVPGAMLGAGVAPLLRYLMADEDEREFNDYLGSVLKGGLGGGALGGLAGAGLGAFGGYAVGDHMSRDPEFGARLQKRLNRVPPKK